MFKEALKLIEKYETVIIHRHTRPDGDAIGSQVGLKHLILDNYPTKRVYTVGDAAGRYSFIEDSTPDLIDDCLYKNALAIVLDTSASALISDNRYTLAAATLRFDHHLFCEKICELEVTDSSYESCCGLITHFAMECGLTISELAAKSLYTGMVTDSGRFRYDSTTPRTHLLASRLLEAGFSTADIYRNLYTDDYSFVKLRAQFVLKIQFTPHRVAYIYTTREEMESYNADPFTISRGMVNVMGELRGVDVWVNFTETDAGVLCELRSGLYNVNAVAKKYGGGGHEKASGATVADRECAMRMLEDLNLVAEGKYEY